MPKYNINKIRSAGLRYIVSDEDGQMWAFELPPVRSGSHWRLADEHICPSHRGGSKGDDEEYWRENIHRWYAVGRIFCMPIYDVPFSVSFYDEPYDIVEHGLVNLNDIKKWPEYDSMKRGTI